MNEAALAPCPRSPAVPPQRRLQRAPGDVPDFPAAVLGGIGFGFFIDELGKFITSDNNYFFEPAAALIYLIFIGLFLLTRSLQHRRGLSPDEKLSNAIDLIGEAARRDFDVNEKGRALEFVEDADRPTHWSSRCAG